MFLILTKAIVWLRCILTAQLSLFTDLEPVKRIYDRLVDNSTQESVKGISVFPGTVTLRLYVHHLPCLTSMQKTCMIFCFFFPACSLNGSPSGQRWYFAVQACQGVTQVRH